MSLPEKKTEPIPQHSATESYQDLRQWLSVVDGFGELERIDNADWNLEVGTLAELIYRERTGVNPALLFDHIKDYPKRLSHSRRTELILAAFGADLKSASRWRWHRSGGSIQEKTQHPDTYSSQSSERRTDFLESGVGQGYRSVEIPRSCGS
jgi:3-polyprenyl-4-hydroxybenzoate decarboxylase